MQRLSRSRSARVVRDRREPAQRQNDGLPYRIDWRVQRHRVVRVFGSMARADVPRRQRPEEGPQRGYTRCGPLFCPTRRCLGARPTIFSLLCDCNVHPAARRGTASCDCGVTYVPVGKRAEAVVAAHPKKSNYTIAEEIGVGKETVRRVRKSTVAL